MAVLWGLHPAIWISQGGCLSQQRPSDGPAMAGWAFTECPLLVPWKAVTWLPQHPTQPSRGVMADGGQPRPQTQSHHPKGPSCKSAHAFGIKFGRWTLPSVWPWSSTARHPRVPHCGHSTRSQSPITCSYRPRLRGKGEKITLALKGLCLDPRLSGTKDGSGSFRDALELLSSYHSRLQQGREHWARGQDVNWALDLPLKPALCSAGGATHVKPPLNSHQRAAGIILPQSLWAPSSKSAYASLLWKSLLEWRIQWASTDTELDWVVNHTQSMQNISNVINAMYFQKWNNYSWLHLLVGIGSETVCGHWCE